MGEKFSGRVAEFQPSTQGGSQGVGQVWDFEIRHRDAAGTVDRSVTVHMVAFSFSARLQPDEEVTIELPLLWKEGQVANVRRVWSNSRKIWIDASSGWGWLASSGWGWLADLFQRLGLKKSIAGILATLVAGTLIVVASQRPRPSGVVFDGNQYGQQHGKPATPATPATPKTATVPSVKGLDAIVADDRLKAAGFVPVGAFENSTEVPFGKVVRTDPPAGQAAKHGAHIVMYTSSGPPINVVGSKNPQSNAQPSQLKVTVPAVTGLDGIVAAQKLSAAGFSPVQSFEPSHQVAFGKVIRTEPSGGTVAERGANITVYTSVGP